MKVKVNVRVGRVRKTWHGRNGFGEQTERAVVARYLPSNYDVTGEDDEFVYFSGVDNAGWTMDGYVIPRLASGLWFAEEIV